MAEPLPGDEARMPIYPLETLRVKPGQQCFIRTLSTKIGGLNTHWLKGRSHYCDPFGCRPELHKLPKVWKGYIAAEVWLGDQEHWLQVALELTEALELDMRDRFARGQVWLLKRIMGRNGAKSPITGQLMETLDPKQLPSSFDLIPILQTLYHASVIVLDQANPMPQRPTARPSVGAPPAALQAEQLDRAASPDDVAALKSKIGDFLRRRKGGS